MPDYSRPCLYNSSVSVQCCPVYGVTMYNTCSVGFVAFRKCSVSLGMGVEDVNVNRTVQDIGKLQSGEGAYDGQVHVHVC